MQVYDMKTFKQVNRLMVVRPTKIFPAVQPTPTLNLTVFPIAMPNRLM